MTGWGQASPRSLAACAYLPSEVALSKGIQENTLGQTIARDDGMGQASTRSLVACGHLPSEVALKGNSREGIGAVMSSG